MPQKKSHIALHGEPRVGKDTIAGILRDDFGFRPAAFADALREEICAAYPGVTPTFLTHPASKESPQPALALSRCRNPDFVRVAQQLLGPESGTRPLSPRWVMRTWGSEYRRVQSPSYWVAKAQGLLQDYPNDRFVFTDNRFADETDWLRSIGSVFVTVVRPMQLRTHAVAPNHISDQYRPPTDYLLSNDGGSLKMLREQVHAMVATLHLND